MQDRLIPIPEKIRVELMKQYTMIESVIQSRLKEFQMFERDNIDKLFAEMSFCVLTPQSRAKAADAAVKELMTIGLLFRGTHRQVANVLRRYGVRFYEAKSRYIILNRYLLNDDGRVLKKMLSLSPFDSREALTRNVWGFGYKEASHFLRNIGFTGLSILDRHILRNMQYMGIINEIPRTLSRRKYLELEQVFIATAQSLGLSPEALDLLLWYRATGEVFK